MKPFLPGDLVLCPISGPGVVVSVHSDSRDFPLSVQFDSVDFALRLRLDGSYYDGTSSPRIRHLTTLEKALK